MPHRKVLTRLGSSAIHGVGVFAIKAIRKGTDIFPDIDDEIIWISAKKIRTLSGTTRRLYEDFCVIKGDMYGCPRSFNLMNASWYINHSPTPNLRVDANYRVFAARNIRKGEELTLDYTTFMDVAIPATWKQRGRSKPKG